MTCIGCGDKFGGKWIKSELDEIFGATEVMLINPGTLENAGQILSCVLAHRGLIDSVISQITRKPEAINKVWGPPIAGKFPKKLVWCFLRQVGKSSFSIDIDSAEQQCSNSHYHDLPSE